MKTRKPPPKCPLAIYDWIREPDQDGAGVLSINGTRYAFSTLREAGGRLLGYRLEKPDGESYTLNVHDYPDVWTCPCGDFQFRRSYDPATIGPCKHVASVQGALARLKSTEGGI